MQSIKQVLTTFDPQKDKYVSREFQTFGLHLAEELDDYRHKSLYIKLAKTVHRSILEQALSFVVDSKADNKGALFMWKLKELRKGERGLQAHLFISGTVQGVGFRYFVRSNARQLGLTGWVRNISDGRVEAVVQGDKKISNQLIELCNRGPFLAEVKGVETRWEAKSEDYKDFFLY